MDSSKTIDGSTIVEDLYVAGSLTVSGNLTAPTATITTLNSTTANATTLNSTTANATSVVGQYFKDVANQTNYIQHSNTNELYIFNSSVLKWALGSQHLQMAVEYSSSTQSRMSITKTATSVLAHNTSVTIQNDNTTAVSQGSITSNAGGSGSDLTITATRAGVYLLVDRSKITNNAVGGRTNVLTRYIINAGTAVNFSDFQDGLGHFDNSVFFEAETNGCAVVSLAANDTVKFNCFTFNVGTLNSSLLAIGGVIDVIKLF